MRERIRPHLTYANVMVTALVLVVLGGLGGVAAAGGVHLGKDAVKARNIAPSAVTTSKVKNGSLLAKDLKAGQLLGGSFASNSVSQTIAPETSAQTVLDLKSSAVKGGLITVVGKATLLASASVHLVQDPPGSFEVECLLSADNVKTHADVDFYDGTNPPDVKLTASGQFVQVPLVGGAKVGPGRYDVTVECGGNTGGSGSQVSYTFGQLIAWAVPR